MIFPAISKEDSLYYRGIAILLIAAHNFMHVLPPVAGENEFDFDGARANTFISLLAQTPADFLHQTLSYLGHYGVQIFIFLSAYGLTRRYGDGVPGFTAFIWKRVVRIYPAFLMSVLLWLAVTLIYQGVEQGWSIIQNNAGVLLAKMIALPNVSPQQALRPVGPWWFLPFIMQFYLVFPLLMRAVNRYGDKMLALLAIASLVLLIGARAEGLVLYYNLPGHLPEIVLGMYVARRGEIRVPGWLILLAVIVFVWGNVDSFAWRFSHLSALLILMALLEKIRPWLQSIRSAKWSLALLGGLSLQLFFINGFIRDLFLPWAKAPSQPLWSVLVCAIFISATLILSKGMLQLERRLIRRRT